MALGKQIFGDGKKYYRSEYKFSATHFATKIAEEIPVDDGLFQSPRDPLVYALDSTLYSVHGLVLIGGPMLVKQ
jgi:hypothetical protein